MSDYRKQVAEELIRHIEAGTTPWQKPWAPDVIRSAPFNPTSGNNYRGINAWWLDTRGYYDPRWMTYRQAAAAGAQVRKGEKGTLIEFWKWTERETLVDEAGKPLLDDGGRQRYRETRLDRPKVFHAVVFNAQQIDGLEPYKAPEPSFSPVERAEQVLAGAGVPIHHDQADRAFYRPHTDQIHLPAQAAFNGAYDYYATALHELGHATGHPSRLAREFGPFGSEVYAKEELRAEMASFMVATELGLGHYPERHASYVGSWLKALKDDRNLLFVAARDAETIRTWVLEPEKRLSLEMARGPEKAPAPEIGLAVGLSADEYAAKIRGTLDTLSPTLAYKHLTNASAAYYGHGMQSATAYATDIARVWEAEKMPLADAETLLHRTAIAGDWPAKAAEAMGLSSRDDFAKLSRELPHIDWDHDHSDDGDVRRREAGRISTVQAVTAGLVTKSAAHAELASVVWDELCPKNGRHPADASPFPGYVPAKDRTHELVGKLTVDPFAAVLSAHGLPAEFVRVHQAEQAMTTEQSKRTYLNVPFAEKNDAKSLGAKWDRREKAWFVPEGVSPEPFKQWMTKQERAPAPEISPVEEFAAALKENGLILKDAPTMDGHWHRVSVEGDKKGQVSGSYRGFVDGRPAGQIMNYRNGDKAIQWVATGNRIDPAEYQHLKTEAAERKVQQQAELQTQYRAVAKRAYGIFMNAAPAPDNHVYLVRKGVQAADLRVDGDGNLLVPMRDEKGFLWNLQTIKPDGSKLFMKDSLKSGLMHVIKGNAKGPTIIAEGYATAADLHQATGRTVVVAFDAGNLEAVAKALKKKSPDLALVIAADDDHKLVAEGKANVGIERAKAAAQSVDGLVIVPPLLPGEKLKGMSDFNDLKQERGPKALTALVAEQLGETKSKKVGRDRQPAQMAV